MKKLSYHYHLKITLSEPVTMHSFTLRCIPASDARQRILACERFIGPADFLCDSRDQWGNALIYGRCSAPHIEFEVNICGQALTGLARSVPAENEARDSLFRFPTALTAAEHSLILFAEGLSLHGSVLSQAELITRAVHEQLSYRPGTTTVHTTAAEALAAGAGVCQDYAHVMLALLRSRGIPCRYAVGMLMGEGKSHAWVEVLSGSCWYSFDPTNCTPITDGHIKLSHGRDFYDCVINRGLFRGPAAQETNVSVIVSEIK